MNAIVTSRLELHDSPPSPAISSQHESRISPQTKSTYLYTITAFAAEL
jgi:hypothetical protein